MSAIDAVKLVCIVIGGLSGVTALLVVLWKAPRWIERVEQTIGSVNERITKTESAIAVERMEREKELGVMRQERAELVKKNDGHVNELFGLLRDLTSTVHEKFEEFATSIGKIKGFLEINGKAK